MVGPGTHTPYTCPPLMTCPDPDAPKCALIVGHRPSSPGAASVGGVTEYDFNTPIAQSVAASVQDVRVEVVRRGDYPGGYSDLPDKVNATGADFAMELHFNSVDFMATGSETLFCSVSGEGQHLAKIALDEIVDALGLPRRGAKPRAEGERGGTLLWGTTMPTIICEPFFGSNRRDWQRAVERKEMLARAYARTASEYAATLS